MKKKINPFVEGMHIFIIFAPMDYKPIPVAKLRRSGLTMKKHIISLYQAAKYRDLDEVRLPLPHFNKSFFKD